MMFNGFSFTIISMALSLALTDAHSTCEADGCQTGFECRRDKVLKSAKSPRCLPNIRDILRDRWDQWEAAWNARDFQTLEEFYTADSIFVTPGAEIRNGSQGFAEYIEGLIDNNGWQSGEWTIKDVIYVTDELVFTTDTGTIQSDQRPTTVKDIILWKKEGGIYKIRYEVTNTP